MSEQYISPEEFDNSFFNGLSPLMDMGDGFDEYQSFPAEAHQEIASDIFGNDHSVSAQTFPGIEDVPSLNNSFFNQSFPAEVHQEIVYDNNQTVSPQTVPGIDDNFYYQSIPLFASSADPQNIQDALDQEQLLNRAHQVSNNLGYVYPQVQGSTTRRVDALQASQYTDDVPSLNDNFPNQSIPYTPVYQDSLLQQEQLLNWTNQAYLGYGCPQVQVSTIGQVGASQAPQFIDNLGHQGVSAQPFPVPSLNDNFPNQSISYTPVYQDSLLQQEQLLNWTNQAYLGYGYPQVQVSTIGQVGASQAPQFIDNLGHQGVSVQPFPVPSLNDNFPNQSISYTPVYQDSLLQQEQLLNWTNQAYLGYGYPQVQVSTIGQVGASQAPQFIDNLGHQGVSVQPFPVPSLNDNFPNQSISYTPVYQDSLLQQEQLLNWTNQAYLGYGYPQVQVSTIGQVGASQAPQFIDNLGHQGVSAQPFPVPSLNDNFPNQSIPNTLDFSVETVTPIGIITTEYLLQLYGKKKREEAAAILQVSVSTFKRICRDHGIPRWPHVTGGRRN